MTLPLINIWHEKARPTPTEADLRVQLGCHVEEMAEMFDTFDAGLSESGNAAIAFAAAALTRVADMLKTGAMDVRIHDRKELLDSLCDQIVTAVGVGHCSKLNVVEGCRRVNDSNWSKFENGEPLRDMHGKITKSPNYQPPALDGLY
jgi:hypothetical protein